MTRIIAALIMGAHVVINSPISTFGALAVAGLGYAALVVAAGIV